MRVCVCVCVCVRVRVCVCERVWLGETDCMSCMGCRRLSLVGGGAWGRMTHAYWMLLLPVARQDSQSGGALSHMLTHTNPSHSPFNCPRLPSSVLTPRHLSSSPPSSSLTPHDPPFFSPLFSCVCVCVCVRACACACARVCVGTLHPRVRSREGTPTDMGSLNHATICTLSSTLI